MAAAPFRALLDTTTSRPDSAIVVKCLCNFLTFLSKWIAKINYLHSYNNDKKQMAFLGYGELMFILLFYTHYKTEPIILL